MPTVKTKRSMDMTALSYSISTTGNKQILRISSFTKGCKINVPLKGFTMPPTHLVKQKDGTFVKQPKGGFGNVKVVLKGSYIEMHYTAKTKEGTQVGPVCALDFGYTEVATDNLGNHYGTGLGTFLTSRSNASNAKNKQRNKILAIRNKAAAKGQWYKVARINKYNLGTKKRDLVNHKNKETIARIINEGLNKFLTTRKPSKVIIENLSHVFKFKSSKGMNRKMSGWVKGSLVERLEFKTLAGRSSHEQVNACFTSQTCPVCAYVDKHNRKGDMFKCLMCGHEGHSDSIAAMNILSRYGDQEISSYMSVNSVKEVLDRRFQQRRETEGQPSGTVIARTLEPTRKRRSIKE